MADRDVVEQNIDVNLKAISDYWTEEAMAEAIPIELIRDVSLKELSERAPDNEPWVQDGIMQQMENTAAQGEFHAYPDADELPPAALAAGYTTSLVPIGNYAKFPWQAVGKIYMVFGGKNYVGSAWAIAGTESCIFTAGHCVYDQKAGWASNIKFEARYFNGASAGTWYMKTLYSVKGWTSNGDHKYDMGAGLATQAIRPKIGALGWMANYPANQGPYTGIGYPAKVIPGYTFNGQQMWQSIGNYVGGSNPIQAYNNMTGGCSGGPWVVYKSGVPYANGLNSFRYTNDPSTMYSPYFGEAFLNIFNTIKGK